MTQDSERRIHDRIPVRIRMEMLSLPGMEHYRVLETGNLSLGGALCKGECDLPIGTMVRCKIHFPEGTGLFPIFSDAVIIRRDVAPSTRPKNLMALKFIKLHVEDRDDLQRFLYGPKPESAYAALPQAEIATAGGPC